MRDRSVGKSTCEDLSLNPSTHILKKSKCSFMCASNPKAMGKQREEVTGVCWLPS